MRTDPVLLYDGTCGFCSGIVQFVLRRDRRQTLRFAALGGDYAEQVAATFPEVRTADSVVWVEGGSGRILTRSDAVLRLAQYLGGLWRLMALFAVVPRPIRDRVYDLVARHRHRLTARGAECSVPRDDVGNRFL